MGAPERKTVDRVRDSGFEEAVDRKSRGSWIVTPKIP